MAAPVGRKGPQRGRGAENLPTALDWLHDAWPWKTRGFFPGLISRYLVGAARAEGMEAAELAEEIAARMRAQLEGDSEFLAKNQVTTCHEYIRNQLWKVPAPRGADPDVPTREEKARKYASWDGAPPRARGEAPF